jgi:hypothetical protein
MYASHDTKNAVDNLEATAVHEKQKEDLPQSCRDRTEG